MFVGAAKHTAGIAREVGHPGNARAPRGRRWNRQRDDDSKHGRLVGCTPSFCVLSYGPALARCLVGSLREFSGVLGSPRNVTAEAAAPVFLHVSRNRTQEGCLRETTGTHTLQSLRVAISLLRLAPLPLPRPGGRCVTVPTTQQTLVHRHHPLRPTLIFSIVSTPHPNMLRRAP